MIKLGHASRAALVAAMVLTGAGAASAQAVGVDFGDIKSGITTAGPDTDRAAINAPTAEPGPGDAGP